MKSLKMLLLGIVLVAPMACSQNNSKDAGSETETAARVAKEMREASSIADAEVVFTKWVENGGKDILPYVALAYQYIEKDTNRARARQLTTAGMAIMLQGAFKDDESTIPASPYAKYLYFFTAILDYHEGVYPSALKNIYKTLYMSGNDADSDTYYRMGQIYAAMDSSAQAERAYFYGYTRGTPEAGDSLKANFTRNGIDYTTRMRELSEQEFEKAPEFTGRTLDGRDVALSDYRGRVVVLNFWFIGCGGCVVEEEALARLTKEYDTPEVALIGLARDEGEKVTKYFNGEIIKGKGHEYYHMQIPGAADAIKAYNVRGYPTHVIIDRYGRITSKTTGGSSMSDEMLKPVIEAAKGY